MRALLLISGCIAKLGDEPNWAALSSHHHSSTNAGERDQNRIEELQDQKGIRLGSRSTLQIQANAPMVACARS
jgi:hypothetical protein